MGQGREAPGRGTGNTVTRQPALVYTARPREDGDAPNVITGAFLFHNVPYTTLIDIGSTHSCIACTVFCILGIKCESYVNEMTVLSPIGQSVKGDKFFRDVPLEIQGVIVLADLMELPFGEFDLILGMDWLVKHHAKLDCAPKRLVLKSIRDEELAMIGERRDFLSIVISALRAEKLVRKGCEAFLASINLSEAKGPSVQDVRTVKEFSDVFPDDIPGFPSNREVEYGIELLLGKVPVSIAPYRMASKELVELNAQIQELLDRGFIRPNYDYSIENHLGKAKEVAEVLSLRAISDLRAMLARLSLYDDGSLLAELQVRHTWTEQIKGKQLMDESLVSRFRQLENGKTSDFGLNNEGVLCFRGRKLAKLYMAEIVRLHGLPVSYSYLLDIAWRVASSGARVGFDTEEKILRFGRKGKLSPRFIGPYRILKRVGPVAYQLKLPLELDQIQDVFHVSMLRRYHSDPTHIMSVAKIEVRSDLTFEEELGQILDREVKVLRKKSITLVKGVEL
ncbi:uncharacterized protein [Gossypium hirsutum]|uniref:Tf2-1-like SH3-like domain-containing protein n=1 Tax=Gossypium hirsutum TaxID=3635 RepID=A0A1U8KGI4_GOSHI|nr:uncharacterized protein LOC107915424 [Gossypium hirsutum]